MPDSWSQAVLRVFEHAVALGESVPVGDMFVYEIPQKLVPRKYPGLFAQCLGEGGYEVGLLPKVCEIRTNGRRRSGTLTLIKV